MQQGERVAKKSAARRAKERAKAADKAAKEGARAAERDARERERAEQRRILEQGLDDVDVAAAEAERLAALQEQAGKGGASGHAAPPVVQPASAWAVGSPASLVPASPVLNGSYESPDEQVCPPACWPVAQRLASSTTAHPARHTT
jgi:hypothetical protein